jgi:SAM-dependent methyltransferase
MASTSALERPWYTTAFDRVWLRLHPRRDDGEAQRFAPTIVRLLGLKVGDRVLDVACGAGRYCRALAARGLKVTGIDLSADLLEEARARSPNLPGMPLYLRWDARALPFREQFEGAASVFTSLGYFDSRQDDLLVLKGVERALVRGGAFLLDYLNPAAVRASLVAEEREEVPGLTAIVRRHVEEGAASGPHVVKHVEARHTGTDLVEAAYVERVRLYEPEEIDALLREAGLEPTGERLGDLAGAPFTPTSERQVRVAVKPRHR